MRMHARARYRRLAACTNVAMSAQRYTHAAAGEFEGGEVTVNRVDTPFGEPLTSLGMEGFPPLMLAGSYEHYVGMSQPALKLILQQAFMQARFRSRDEEEHSDRTPAARGMGNEPGVVKYRHEFAPIGDDDDDDADIVQSPGLHPVLQNVSHLDPNDGTGTKRKTATPGVAAAA